MNSTINATPTAKLTNRRKRSLANRVLALQEKGRTVFARKDDLFQALIEGCAIGEVIETARGAFIIQDNFANGRNVAFRPASVHRFELKEHRPPSLPKSRRARSEAPPASELPRTGAEGEIHQEAAKTRSAETTSEVSPAVTESAP